MLILFMTFAHFSILDHYSRMTGAAALDFDNWLAVFLKAGLARLKQELPEPLRR